LSSDYAFKENYPKHYKAMCVHSFESALFAASHDYILGTHVNKHTILNNVKFSNARLQLGGGHWRVERLLT